MTRAATPRRKRSSDGDRTASFMWGWSTDEINAGRLAEDQAAGAITATLLATFTPPGDPAPPR